MSQWMHCCYYFHHLNWIRITTNHLIFLQTQRYGLVMAIRNIVLHCNHAVVSLSSPDVHQHFKPSRRCHTAGLLKGADKIICRLHLNYPGDLRDDAVAISPSARLPSQDYQEVIKQKGSSVWHCRHQRGIQNTWKPIAVCFALFPINSNNLN